MEAAAQRRNRGRRGAEGRVPDTGRQEGMHGEETMPVLPKRCEECKYLTHIAMKSGVWKNDMCARIGKRFSGPHPPKTRPRWCPLKEGGMP